MKLDFSKLEVTLDSLFAGGEGAVDAGEDVETLCAHSALDGAGTKKAGYALPESGPFKCANCIHVSEDKTSCDHPEVIADPDVPKTEDGKHASIHADSCCNYFHPEDEDEE